MLEFVEGPVNALAKGPQKELERLSDALKFRPENYWRAASYQLFESTSGEQGWDGYLRPFKVNYEQLSKEKVAKSGSLARGLLEQIVEKAENLGLQVKVVRPLKNPLSGVVPDDIPDDIIKTLQVDENQRECVACWLSHGIGIQRVTVSGGKTAMFAAAAEMLKRSLPQSRILYVTHTERLVRQSAREFKKFLPHRNITQFGGGVRDSSGTDIVVATVATLYRNLKELTKTGWFKTFTAVLFDEVHHASSSSSERVLARILAYYRFGASDSVRQDDPVAHMKIVGHFGPIRRNIEPLELILSGRLAAPHIYVVDNRSWHDRFKNTNHQAEPETPAWALLGGEWKKALYLGPVFEKDDDGNDKLDKHGDPIKLPSIHRLLVDNAELEVSSRWCLLERTYDKAIIRFKERNEMIAHWVKHYTSKGWPTLVVATRTLHVLILESEIRKAVEPDREVKILFSENSSAERDETFQWFKQSDGGVLITPLVKEGVSINEIRAGVIADPVSSWEYAKQLIGRFIRKKETDNNAHITWFMDRQCRSFRQGCFSVFEKLENIRGFNFYHPCLGPESVSKATKYSATI